MGRRKEGNNSKTNNKNDYIKKSIIENKQEANIITYYAA